VTKRSDSSPGSPGGSDRPAGGKGDGGSPVPGGTPSTVDPDDEVIDEAGEESFPASDSPSSWAGPPSEPG